MFRHIPVDKLRGMKKHVTQVKKCHLDLYARDLRVSSGEIQQKSSAIVLLASVLAFKDFVPRLELLTIFKDIRKSSKMCKMDHFSLFCKACLAMFLTFVMALRLYALPQ